jgi:hypothetical protein
VEEPVNGFQPMDKLALNQQKNAGKTPLVFSLFTFIRMNLCD